MNYDKLNNEYWKYYKLLEERFLNSLKYVELNPLNYNTYSIEFANQLISIGSELDVFFKVVSNLNSGIRPNISDYYKEVTKKFPNIKDQEVIIKDKREIKIKPFETWEESKAGQSLDWWDAYNNIKHNRVENMEKANLKNAFNILGALFILEMYLFKDIYNRDKQNLDVPKESSKIFELSNWEKECYSGPLTFEYFKGDSL